MRWVQVNITFANGNCCSTSHVVRDVTLTLTFIVCLLFHANVYFEGTCCVRFCVLLTVKTNVTLVQSIHLDQTHVTRIVNKKLVHMCLIVTLSARSTDAPVPHRHVVLWW